VKALKDEETKGSLFLSRYEDGAEKILPKVALLADEKS